MDLRRVYGSSKMANEFQWYSASVDVNGPSNPGISAVTGTLATLVGVRCKAPNSVVVLLGTTVATDNPVAELISDLNISDQSPSVNGALTFINYYSTIK
jgi:hypothetical protein